TKAELEPSSWYGLALRGPGASDVEVPAGAVGLAAGWPGVAGLDLLSEGEVALAGVPLVDVAALEALRIECGVPAMGAELTDATIPAEAGQWLIDASASFTKGCYTGQELVARIDSRGGNVPRHLRGVELAGDVAPEPGSPVVIDGDGVGTVTSVAPRPGGGGSVALAVVRRAVTPPAAGEVVVDGRSVPATVLALPYES
ncbi:MAG: YgfZ/GcvT domain-containing protein, partial [Acidimicrobiales bacterium]